MLCVITRRLRLHNLDALLIVHYPFDCLFIYFCICFTFIRIVYDIYDPVSVKDVYFIALVFTVGMGSIMSLWANRAFKNLKLENTI